MALDLEYQRKYHGRTERTVVCVACGAEFKTYYQHKVTCSKACSLQRRRNDALKVHYSDPVRASEIRRRHRLEHKEQEQAKNKEWRARNPGRVKELRKKHQATHIASTALWVKNNPERKAAINEKRRAIKMNADDGVDSETVVKRIRMFGGCAYCGKENGKLTVDHVVALSKGGRHKEMNLVGACRRCNSSKGIKNWREWYKAQSFHSLQREYMIVLATA